jgi:Phosphotransferase enzyme family
MWELATGVDPLAVKASTPRAPRPACPPGQSGPGSVIEVVRVLRARAPDADEIFCHRDNHPGDVLFDEEQISGNVDWQGAKLALTRSMSLTAEPIWPCTRAATRPTGSSAPTRSRPAVVSAIWLRGMCSWPPSPSDNSVHRSPFRPGSAPDPALMNGGWWGRNVGRGAGRCE